MIGLDSIVVTAEFRSLVRNLVDRLGPLHIVADDPWRLLADRFDVTESDAELVASLVVGSPAAVLKHADRESAEFGFVMPVAQLAKWWQRAPAWRDDATLHLWHAGWTPLTVDRLIVASELAPIEFAIGNARPTPQGSDLVSQPLP